MAENVARTTVKLGMKAWFMANDWVRTHVAQLREDLEDTVAEARQEYERQAGTIEQLDADSARQASTTDAAPKPQHIPARPVRRTRARGETAGTSTVRAV
jgi:hypothetical protein